MKSFVVCFALKKKLDLKNKTAVVTGVSSGLGSAIARVLIDKSVEVYGLARNEIKLKELEKELGKKFHPVKMDISNLEEIKNWITKSFSDNYSPDILINNAGIGSYGAIDKKPVEDWLQMVNTNLNGTYYITSQLIPFMKRKKEMTHIINIGSILGTIACENGSAYCTTKFGIQGFSEALFKELRVFDIKVSLINPGSIDTDFFKSSGINKHHNMLQPKDLAGTVIYLLETPDNMLIDKLTVRPLNPKSPTKN